MSLHDSTKNILKFLKNNSSVRVQICAAPDKTLLYAGKMIRPAWQELNDLKRTHALFADKEILPDVLRRIAISGQPYSSLLEWAWALDKIEPWKNNGFIVWRALSGIFAANAVGKVSFYIGSGITRSEKVFAATEISVLARNPNIDELTRDVLAYYQRCLKEKQSDMNFGFIVA